MVAQIQVKGVEQLQALSKVLRTAPKDLQRESYRSLNRVTAPLKKDAQASALATLPSRGGLADKVAKSKFTTRRRGGAHASISIIAKGGRSRSGQLDIAAMDAGRVRHPVFGRVWLWVLQRVKPKWFTRPMEKGAPKVRRELIKAMRLIVEKIARAT